MVHYRRGVAVSPDRGWPKRLVNERITPPVHIQDGSGWGQVPPLGWREQEEEYSCRRPERQTGVEEVDSVETEACKSRKFERWRAASGAARVSVDIWTVRGALTTSWAVVGTAWRVQMKEWGRPTQVDRIRLQSCKDNGPMTLEYF